MTNASDDYFDLCSLDDLREKKALRFHFAGPGGDRHEIGLFWDGESAYAIDNYCPHEFALLSFGSIEPQQVMCPLHAALFDLKTGECLDKFTDDVTPYEASVHGGRVWVHAPGEHRYMHE